MRRLFALLFLAALGCADLHSWDKKDLERRVMQADDAPLETMFQNKIYLSRGVSGGRAGMSAGGGCGCSN